MSSATPTSPSIPWLSPALLVLAALGFAAIWTLVAVYTNRQVSWLAVIGALDVAWMLRLSGWPRGRSRVLAALAATAAMVVAANWAIIASHLGAALGLEPWESVLRLGSDHAWTLARLANGPLDLLWVGVALVTAAWVAR